MGSSVSAGCTANNKSSDVPLLSPIDPLPRKKSKASTKVATKSKTSHESSTTTIISMSTTHQEWGSSPVGYKHKTKSNRLPSIPLDTDASLPTKSVPSPTTKSARHSSRKTVSFAMQDSIRNVELLSDLDAAEIARCWWSASDYDQIRRDYQAVAHWLETQVSDENVENNDDHNDDQENMHETHCARGLHARTAAGAWTLYEHVRNGRNAVLDLQEAMSRPQRRGSTNSPCTTHSTTTTDLALAIAQAYAVETLPLRQAALDRAARDAAAIQSYLQGNKDTQTRRVARRTVPLPIRDHCGAANHPLLAPKAQLHDSWTSLSALKAHKPKSGTTQQSPVTATPDLLDSMMESDETVVQQGSTKKCVRFSCAKDVIIPGRQVNDLDKDQRRKWYSGTELARIQSTCDALVQQWEQTSASSADSAAAGSWLEDDHGDCWRGLEHKTTQGAAQLSDRRQAAWATVLEFTAQHGTLQRSTNQDGYVASLADAYRQVTQDACRDAIKLGKQDAKQAKKHRLRRKSVQCTKTETVHGFTSPKIATGAKCKQVSQPQSLDHQHKQHHRRSSCSAKVPGGFDHQAAHRMVQQRV
jgi:hypothetical protein